MKKYLAVATIVVVLFSSAAEAKYDLTTAIRIYGPGEFAVKGLVEEQAEAFIKMWTQKPVRIFIEGSADKKGDAAFNDKIGKWRADEMKAFMEIRFPDAKVFSRSIGDQLDVRQVQISVEFAMTAAPVLKPAAQPLTSKKVSPLARARELIIISLAIAVTVLAPIIVLLYLRRRGVKSSKPVDITIAGKTYRCHPEVKKDGRLITFHQIRPGEFLSAANEADWKKSVRSSLNKDPRLVVELIKQGKLQPV